MDGAGWQEQEAELAVNAYEDLSLVRKGNETAWELGHFLGQSIKGGFTAALGAAGLRTASGVVVPSEKVIAESETPISAYAQEDVLHKIKFRNSGVVTRKMLFQYLDPHVDYMETEKRWSTSWGDVMAPYLFEVQNNQRRMPPSCMRSAVVLGGLGSGTIEPRAEGAIMDWNIFNNSPAQDPRGLKVQLPEALWGLRLHLKGLPAKAWTLRTHPPVTLPAIERIEYSGAFPVSRMKFSEPELPLAVELYNYCSFVMRQPKVSSTLAVLFNFILHNPTRKDVEVELMFNLPNHFRSRVETADRGLTLATAGDLSHSGSLTLRMADPEPHACCLTAGDLQKQWKSFDEKGVAAASAVTESNPVQVGLAAGVTIRPGQSRTVTFVLAWYFPHRPHMFGQILPNSYTTFYKVADGVAEQTVKRIPEIQQAALQRQQFFSENSLPGWFGDALVNSVATSYKTGVFFAPGFFRQWEAFPCPNDTPTYIHMYSSLPYMFFYPEFDESIFRSFAAAQRANGCINKDLRHATRRFGDSNLIFNLGVCRYYLLTADRHFLDEMWPHVKNSVRWGISNNLKFGVPNHVCNTYYGWDFTNDELIAYGVILHLASLQAAEAIAKLEGDPAFAQLCKSCPATGQKALDERMWNDHYFRTRWTTTEENYPMDAIMGDTLYAELWTTILGLPEVVEDEKVRSHLAWELKRLDSPNGERFYSDLSEDDQYPSLQKPFKRPGGYSNNSIWQSASLDWATLSISRGGDVETALDQPRKAVGNWRDKLHDQWNYADGTVAYNGYILVNSHYARQLIFWAIPLVMSGQQYSAPQKKLSFNPKTRSPAKLPWCTPSAVGTLEILQGNRHRFTVSSGRIELASLSVGKWHKKGRLSVRRGDVVTLRGGHRRPLVRNGAKYESQKS